MVLKVISVVLGVAGLAWLALLFSSRAVLIGEKVEDGLLHKKLVCTYFAGSRNFRKEYWYSPNDSFGRAACPRWETVRPAAE